MHQIAQPRSLGVFVVTITQVLEIGVQMHPVPGRKPGGEIALIPDEIPDRHFRQVVWTVDARSVLTICARFALTSIDSAFS